MSRKYAIRALAALLVGSCFSVACERQQLFDNVVLVTIDTLRADHLGCYGYPRPTSPFIDSLAERGVQFDHAVSASSHTAPSHASIFTSHYPVRHRVSRNGVKLKADVPTLASNLRDEGIRTAAVTSVRFLKGVAKGFQETFISTVRAGYRPAEQTVDVALDWIRSHPVNERFALWIHLYDVHNSSPIGQGGTVPREYVEAMRQDASKRGGEFSKFLASEHGVRRQELESDLDKINRYDGQIRFVDTELQRLFIEIEARYGDSRTLWIVTADHGEGLGSHGYVGHGQYLYREQLRVPLIFYGGDRLPAGRVVDSLARSVDLYPTIIDLLGVPLANSARDLEGRSLRAVFRSRADESDDRIAFAQRRPVDDRRLGLGWVDEAVYVAQTDGAKYIRHTESPDEFYNLAEDPLETSNLAGHGGELERQLGGWLARKYQSMLEEPLPGTFGSAEVDEAFTDELRALGYLD